MVEGSKVFGDPLLGSKIDEEDFDTGIGVWLGDIVVKHWDMVDGVEIDQVWFQVVVPDINSMSNEWSAHSDNREPLIVPGLSSAAFRYETHLGIDNPNPPICFCSTTGPIEISPTGEPSGP
jgi:hypothetical protein